MFRTGFLLVACLFSMLVVGCGISPTASRVYELPKYRSIDDVPNARKLTPDEIRAEYIGVKLIGWSPYAAQGKIRRYIETVYQPDGKMLMKVRKAYGDVRSDDGSFHGTWNLHEDGTFTTYNSRINNRAPLGVRRIYYADGVYYEIDINFGNVRFKYVKY